MFLSISSDLDLYLDLEWILSVKTTSGHEQIEHSIGFVVVNLREFVTTLLLTGCVKTISPTESSVLARAFVHTLSLQAFALHGAVLVSLLWPAFHWAVSG